MKTVSKFAMSLFALAMTLALAPAAFAADTGTIKVTVKTADGKDAPEGITVRVMAPGGAKPKAAAKAADGTVLVADEKPKGKGAAAPAIKEGKTDAKGAVTLTEVPVGTYKVGARGKDVGQGVADVTVEKDKTAEVTISLKAPQPKPAK